MQGAERSMHGTERSMHGVERSMPCRTKREQSVGGLELRYTRRLGDVKVGHTRREGGGEKSLYISLTPPMFFCCGSQITIPSISLVFI